MNVPAGSATTTRRIALTGFMGAGKSSAGKELSLLLDIPFMDLDEEIVAGAGRSIPEIFAAEGESGFRAREKDALERAAMRREAFVLACGGGVVLDAANRAVLMRDFFTVWLRVDPKTCIGRVGAYAPGRPLLQTGDPLATAAGLMAEREKFYRESARLDVDGTLYPDPRAVAAFIASALGLRTRAGRIRP